MEHDGAMMTNSAPTEGDFERDADEDRAGR
jgi:hypothetical protein